MHDLRAGLEQLHALRAAGRFDELVAAARNLAAAHPTEVTAQLEAAYACDRYGEETDAIGYYDAAARLDIPSDQRKQFLVGYGSTLRNVGRVAEAIAHLQAATVELPDSAALAAFLALALHAAGRHDEAMVAALDAVLRGPLDGYERALRFYRDELASGPPRA